jgi:hypothetical protein
VLWLLAPEATRTDPVIDPRKDLGDQVQRSLYLQTVSAGVAWKRIIFASRVAKELHILRYNNVFMSNLLMVSHC